MPDRIRLSDEQNIDDFDSDDWAEELGIRRIDEYRDSIDEEAEREGRYAKDWVFQSFKYRGEQSFICENCGVDLSKHQYLLHVHHLNRDKGNNSKHNLVALCVLCHAKHHPHMILDLNPEYERIILELRHRSK